MSTLGYSSGWSQADTRRPAKLRDQHGRQWFAWVENRSGAPTGPISPTGWTAPWYPDQAYLSIDPDDPRTLRIDYARALRERLEAHEDYKKQWTEKAVARNMDPADETHRPALLQLVGPSPAPYQPYKAAMDGNKWILGFTAKPDARLVPYLPTKRAAVEAKLAELESFADEDGPEMFVSPAEDESLYDLDDFHDAEAVGAGKVVAVKPKNKGGRPKKITADNG
jgi:hypothetical protein